MSTRQLKVILLVTLISLLSISAVAYAQDTEEITLSTYYPAPYGEYDELFSERLLVWRPDADEMADMNEGDCHIGWSMIVGAGGTGFSYDELQAAGALPGDGDLLIKGNVGIGTASPLTKLDLRAASINANANGATLSIEESSAWSQAIAIGINNFDEYVGDYYNGFIGLGNSSSLYITAGGRVTGNPGVSGSQTATSTSSAGLVINPGGGFMFQATTGLTPASPYTPINVAYIHDTGGMSLGSSYIGTDPGVGSLIASGNVGIGTTNPQARLHVAGTAGTDGIMFPDGTIQTTAAAGGWIYDGTLYYAGDVDGGTTWRLLDISGSIGVRRAVVIMTARCTANYALLAVPYATRASHGHTVTSGYNSMNEIYSYGSDYRFMLVVTDENGRLALRSNVDNTSWNIQVICYAPVN